MNSAKFLRAPFLQNTSGRLLLLRLKCSVKLRLQSKRIYAPLQWPLRRLSYKPPHLKQHHCNNSWEFKILQQISSEYLLPTSSYENINGTCVNSLERTCCFRNKKEAYKWVFPKPVFALYLSWLITWLIN